MKPMKTITTSIIGLFTFVSVATADILWSGAVDNYLTRTSVQVAGEATWVPALELRIDGVSQKLTAGDTINGVTVDRNHILSQRGAERLVRAADLDVKLVGAMSGGGWDDDNMNGVVDVGEVGGSGW